MRRVIRGRVRFLPACWRSARSAWARGCSSVSPASIVAWMLAGSVVSIIVGVAVAIVRARRPLPPPSKDALRQKTTQALP